MTAELYNVVTFVFFSPLRKCSKCVFLSVFGVIGKTKKLEKVDDDSFKNNPKGVITSTINFGIKMTAAKTKEMILKKLRRRSKDTLGAPKNNRVKHPPVCG